MNLTFPRPKHLLLSLALVLGGSFLVGCNNEKAAPPPPPPPPPVTVAKPVQKEIVEYDEYTGRTDAVESVEIRPRVSGYIDNITFKEGDIVNQGDLLFVIDPRPYQDVLDQNNANLRNAAAQRELQTANSARAEKLFQTKVSSKEEYDTSVAQRNQAEAQYYQAEAQLKSAQLNLDFTQVKAPVTGRISRELVTRGNLVQADTTLLTTLVSVDPIYAYFNVDERSVWRYVDQIRRGERKDARLTEQPVSLHVEGEQGFPHEGAIDFVDNAFETGTATLRIRGRFRNEDGFLVPGTFVRVRVAASPKFTATLITDRAVGTDQGQKFVMVLGPDNTVQARPVELGPLVDGLRVVRKGLEPGDQVLINGLVNARPGSKVTPQTGDMNQFTANQTAMAVSVNKDAPKPGEGSGGKDGGR